MEGQAKAYLLAALILADGFLTWASIEAGGANAREANAFFSNVPHGLFLALALVKAGLWLGAWSVFRQHPKSGLVAYGLTAVYAGVFVWNLGNLAVNL